MSTINEEQMVKKEVAIAWICDACGVQASDKRQYEQEWYHFSKSHQGWGNDSVDSFDSFDVCSADCFIKLLQEHIPDLLEYADKNAEIADMPVKFAEKLLDRLLPG